ncbi:hypothetical protein HanPSC8_Chr13g0547171 [Helianthus annuus]|nr:hypothetical protein HanPSC8_Chr13g0547171 [Helianthus annuus]
MDQKLNKCRHGWVNFPKLLHRHCFKSHILDPFLLHEFLCNLRFKKSWSYRVYPYFLFSKFHCHYL